MNSVSITFNGELKSVQSRTVAALLEEFGLQDKKLAVELNREIVSRSSYAETVLASGDAVEIVTFVGGG